MSQGLRIFSLVFMDGQKKVKKCMEKNKVNGEPEKI